MPVNPTGSGSPVIPTTPSSQPANTAPPSSSTPTPAAPTPGSSGTSAFGATSSTSSSTLNPPAPPGSATQTAGAQGQQFKGNGTLNWGPVTATGSAQGTINDGEVTTATATAALKALLSGTTATGTGNLSITNNSLSTAQFTAALTTLLGPKVSLLSNGAFSYDAKSGISGDAIVKLQKVLGALTIDGGGGIVVQNGKLYAQLDADVKAVLGSNTIVADNEVLFQGTDFQSASLNDELTSKFGPNASLDSTFKASIDASGIKSATLTAAFKTLLGGNTSIDTSGTGLTITNNKLTQAQFDTAVKTVFGSTAVTANGNFTWDSKSGVSGQLVADFKTVQKNLTLDNSGTLKVTGGKVDATLTTAVNDVLGDYTVIANNSVVFKGSQFSSATRSAMRSRASSVTRARSTRPSRRRSRRTASSTPPLH